MPNQLMFLMTPLHYLSLAFETNQTYASKTKLANTHKYSYTQTTTEASTH